VTAPADDRAAMRAVVESLTASRAGMPYRPDPAADPAALADAALSLASVLLDALDGQGDALLRTLAEHVADPTS
jgi:hypothetical protein